MQTKNPWLIVRVPKKDLDYVHEAWMQCVDVSTQTDEAQRTHMFPKWQMGNRRRGKYVLKGEGENVCGLGKCILPF